MLGSYFEFHDFNFFICVSDDFCREYFVCSVHKVLDARQVRIISRGSVKN